MSLPIAVKMWPTPTANAGGGETALHHYQKEQLYKKGLGPKPQRALPLAVRLTHPAGDGSPTTTGEAGGALAPGFVEWLMGMPENWTHIAPTACARSETQSFLRAHNTLLRR